MSCLRARAGVRVGVGASFFFSCFFSFPSVARSSTPLSRAAAKGHLGVVKLLLERGASVNIPGRGGLTPLHEAAGCGQLEVCRVLLGAGAAVAARDHSNRQPLHYSGASVSVTALLLDFGADPEAKVKKKSNRFFFPD